MLDFTPNLAHTVNKKYENNINAIGIIISNPLYFKEKFLMFLCLKNNCNSFTSNNKYTSHIKEPIRMFFDISIFSIKKKELTNNSLKTHTAWYSIAKTILPTTEPQKHNPIAKTNAILNINRKMDGILIMSGVDIICHNMHKQNATLALIEFFFTSKNVL